MNREGYSSPLAFRTAVADRLKTAARRQGRRPAELRREFLFQRFLARLFASTDNPWVLKGGTGLLVRLPGATSSTWFS